MSFTDGIYIIVPVLDPTERLEKVVAGLVDAGFRRIIIVDDGSKNTYAKVFSEVGRNPYCEVLHHLKNKGKGDALKTAFSYIKQIVKETGEQFTGVVTVDGDGQHLPDDVARCAAAISQSKTSVIMGVRDFRHPSAPARNSFGNRITAVAFRVLFGIELRDTQTGLRGIPASLVETMLSIDGHRFEYETNMLLELNRMGVSFHEVEIATVYEEGSNKRSHYRPLIDSSKIFVCLLRYFIKRLFRHKSDAFPAGINNNVENG